MMWFFCWVFFVAYPLATLHSEVSVDVFRWIEPFILSLEAFCLFLDLTARSSLLPTHFLGLLSNVLFMFFLFYDFKQSLLFTMQILYTLYLSQYDFMICWLNLDQISWPCILLTSVRTNNLTSTNYNGNWSQLRVCVSTLANNMRSALELGQSDAHYLMLTTRCTNQCESVQNSSPNLCFSCPLLGLLLFSSSSKYIHIDSDDMVRWCGCLCADAYRLILLWRGV